MTILVHNLLQSLLALLASSDIVHDIQKHLGANHSSSGGHGGWQLPFITNDSKLDDKCLEDLKLGKVVV